MVGGGGGGSEESSAAGDLCYASSSLRYSMTAIDNRGLADGHMCPFVGVAQPPSVENSLPKIFPDFIDVLYNTRGKKNSKNYVYTDQKKHKKQKTTETVVKHIVYTYI